MTDKIYLHTLHVENVKRVKVVTADVSDSSLFVVGGNNKQGKTSFLDALIWNLGGDKYKPTAALRDGADKLAVKITLSNGLIIERTGKNGALKVTDPKGTKAGQALLSEFIPTFALDIPKFMGATITEKTKLLLGAFPELAKRLRELTDEYTRLYNERHLTGQEMVRKKKHAEDLTFIPSLPDKPLSGSEMTKRLTDALAINAANNETRRRRTTACDDIARLEADNDQRGREIMALEKQLADARRNQAEVLNRITNAKAALEAADEAVAAVTDVDTTAIQRELENIDAINAQIRSNLTKTAAADEAERIADEYRDLDKKVDAVMQQKIKCLQDAALPLPGLSIDDDGEIIYLKRKWDSMSAMEQIRVAVAIAAATSPTCGFVFVDKLEQFDKPQLAEFGKWLDEKNLQVIGTRVSTGDECSIVIEDGIVVAENDTPDAEF